MKAGSSRRPELAPGTQVDGYEVISCIGSGGYGDVYKVRRDAGFFALKMARVRADGVPESLATLHENRLLREAECLRVLRDVKGVVRLHGTGRWPEADGGWFYLVLDFVEGAPLNDWRRCTPPSPHQLARTFAQLGRVVDALHVREVFHRDLKSSNVLVSAQGEVTVIDFSVALLPGHPRLTEEGFLPGTRTHFSPEALQYVQGDESPQPAFFPYRPTADLHAAGYMLYEALAGRPPFDTHLPRFELYKQIKTQVPWEPRAINPEVPDALAALAMKLLEKRPEDRLQTGLELAEALEAAAAKADASWDGPLEVPPWTPPMRAEGSAEEWPVKPVVFPVQDLLSAGAALPARKRRGWVAMVAAGMAGGGLVFALAMAAGWLLVRTGAPGQPEVRLGLRDYPTPGPPAPAAEAWHQEGEAVFSPSDDSTAHPPGAVKPAAAVPQSWRGGFRVAAHLCAALVTACATSSPRPDGLPSGMRCPPRASQPLGVKAVRDNPLSGWLETVAGKNFRGLAETVLCKQSPTGCSWVQEGPVEAHIGGWRVDIYDNASPWILPRGEWKAGHTARGVARAEGDNFYFVFTEIHLADGRVFPLCGLGHDMEVNSARWDAKKPPYYKIVKRENGRIFIAGVPAAMMIYLLEDF